MAVVRVWIRKDAVLGLGLRVGGKRMDWEVSGLMHEDIGGF